ncbi:MAG TPA: hypothetical protein PKA00_05745 [Saprospiraceae bacterium]|nr:hypothetical protein [Saprospiraceae bacterium]HMQ82385.1 hypothetical protein [Saprospiraceae bacterium]
MSNLVVLNTVRFIFLYLIQILFLKRLSLLDWQGFIFVNALIYPLFILMLPIRTPRMVILLTAFLMGLMVDFSYDTYGLNAACNVLTAGARPYILAWFEPREGYNVNHSPSIGHMGATWFFRYTAILMGIHIFAYYWLDAFSHVYIISILTKTFFTFIFSMFFISVIVLIFPKSAKKS